MNKPNKKLNVNTNNKKAKKNVRTGVIPNFSEENTVRIDIDSIVAISNTKTNKNTLIQANIFEDDSLEIKDVVSISTNTRERRLINPEEALKSLEFLTEDINYSIKTLKKELSFCDLALADLKHVAQFSENTPDNQTIIINCYNTLVLRRRVLKDYLEQYKSIKNTTEVLSIFSKKFFSDQKKSLKTCSDFFENRIYSPKALTFLQAKNYPRPEEDIKNFNISTLSIIKPELDKLKL